jgi:hypothetical protein
VSLPHRSRGGKHCLVIVGLQSSHAISRISDALHNREEISAGDDIVES